MRLKADGRVTSEEKAALSKFKQTLLDSDLVATATKAKAVSERACGLAESQTDWLSSLDVLLGGLNSLIGLKRVKDDVTQLVNFLKVQQPRQSKGLTV